jgi:hypothetical protein
MSRRELIDIEMQKHAETEKAVLVSDTGMHEDAVWLPISQIEMVPGPMPGMVTVTMPEWLAIDKGLV